MEEIASTPEQLPYWLSQLSAWGTLVGLVLTFFTLRQAAGAKRAAEETKKQVNVTLSLASLARLISSLHQVREYINAQKWELANFRLRELKEVLIELREMNLFQDYAEKQKLKGHIETLGTDITAITNITVNPGEKTVDRCKMIEGLDALSDFINTHESKLKHSTK